MCAEEHGRFRIEGFDIVQSFVQALALPQVRPSAPRAIYDSVVDIEERLLHFAPQAALHAWRLFRVRTEGKRLVLSSPMYHDDATGRTPLWPSVEAKATCYEGHPAPSPGCRCGIYGAVAGTLDSLPGYLYDTAYERNPWAYAEIACHGRVFADMRGVRAERATLVRIALPGSGGPIPMMITSNRSTPVPPDLVVVTAETRRARCRAAPHIQAAQRDRQAPSRAKARGCAVPAVPSTTSPT